MKTTIRLLIGVTAGLLVGFGLGLYIGSHGRNTKVQTMAQTKPIALQQRAESPELREAKRRLGVLLLTFTPESQFVKAQQTRIRELEGIEHTK